MDGKPDSTVAAHEQIVFKAYADFKKADPRSEMFYELDSYAKVLSPGFKLW
jgi:hypothetical protein